MRGVIDDDSLSNVFQQIRRTPDFLGGFNLLFDATGVTKTRITGEGIYVITRMSENDMNRIAFVFRDPLGFGLANLYAMCANAVHNWERVRVFSDRETALDWLQSSINH
jgi:hypothetical protein